MNRKLISSRRYDPSNSESGMPNPDLKEFDRNNPEKFIPSTESWPQLEYCKELPHSQLMQIDSLSGSGRFLECFDNPPDSCLLSKSFPEYLLDKFESLSIPSSIHHTELNVDEQMALGRLELAATSFEEEITMPVVANATSLTYVLNLCEYYIHRTVKYCKQFATFRQLSEDHQIDLLKEFFPQLLLVKILFNYDAFREGFPAIKVCVFGMPN